MEEEHLSPYEATKKAMDGLTGALIATSLVLAAVFVPVSFLSGITGQLYRQFSVTIASFRIALYRGSSDAESGNVFADIKTQRP